MFALPKIVGVVHAALFSDFIRPQGNLRTINQKALGGQHEGRNFTSICGFSLIFGLTFYAFMGGQPAISPAIVRRCSENPEKVPFSSSTPSQGCDCGVLSSVSFVFEGPCLFRKLSMGLQVLQLANKTRLRCVTDRSGKET